jgi:tetratricopeptide (TPR) repeat protein
MALLLPGPAPGMDISWGTHANRERIVLTFDTALPGELPRRTGSREITIAPLPRGERTPKPFDPKSSKLIESLRIGEGGIVLRTRTDSFGYLSFTVPDENKLVVDVFPDALGAKWAPEDQQGSVRAEGAEPRRPAKQAAAKPIKQDASQKNVTETVAPDNGGSAAEAKAASPVQGATGQDNEGNSTDENPVAAVQPSLPSGMDASQRHSGAGEVRARVLPAGPREAPAVGAVTEKVTAAAPPKESPEPTSPPGQFADGMAHLGRGEWAMAAEKLEAALAGGGLVQREREEAAYGVAEAMYRLHGAAPGAKFEPTIRALQRAMNIGPGSPSYPHALFSAGDIQLKVGNEPEARAYFTLLRKKHPDHADVPRSYLSWGLHFLGREEWDKSAEALQTVVQDHPESDIVREAAVALVQALKGGGYWDQAYEIMSFVDRRWPRYYIEDLEFLRTQGIVAMELGKYELARAKLWTNYNLVPEAPGSDIVLARIGDIYLLQGMNAIARQTYQVAAGKYPNREGGLIAAMRLAEQGILDTPSIVEMSAIFENPLESNPQEIYSRIVRDLPQSRLAGVAQLKLAMWLQWNGQHAKALDAVSELRKQSPDKELWGRALEVSAKAFESLVEPLLGGKSFDEILALWTRYPFVADALPSMGVQGKLAMAMAFWSTGKIEEAQDIAEAVMEDDRVGAAERSTAFGLYLTAAADRQQWPEILALEARGAALPLGSQDQSQLRYALALSRENLGRSAESGPAWAALSIDSNLRPTQQGYAYFFMARDAYRDKNLGQAYHLAQEALMHFLQDGREGGRIRDSLDLLIEISERAGRTIKALEWAHEYGKLIPREDPDWPSFQYRLARLYRVGGDTEKWRSILEGLVATDPAGVYGKMSAAELREDVLQRRRSEIR